jgi:hypothetical protein
MDFFCPPFLSARLISYSGTKAAPLLGSGNRGRAILSVSYKNVSAALSHLKIKLSVQVLKPLLGKPVKSALAPLSRYLVHVMEVQLLLASSYQ